MVDVSAPHNSPKSRFKVVVSKDQIGSLLGGRAASTHCESDISFMESRNIIDAITSDDYIALHLLKSNNEQVFVFSGSSGQDFEVRDYFLKLLEILNFGLPIALLVLVLVASSTMPFTSYDLLTVIDEAHLTDLIGKRCCIHNSPLAF